MKKFKKRLLPIACSTFLAPKSFSKMPTNVLQLRCKSSQIQLMANTSNNVIRVNHNGKCLYFRECKIHKELHQYLRDEIQYFYSAIEPSWHDDRKYLEEALSNENSFRKFVNMGMTNDRSSGAYQFCMGNGGCHIGLNTISPDQEERMKDFVQFVWGDLFSYTLNKGVKIGQYQVFNAVRSIASYRLAKLLNIGQLIPKTEYAVLYVDNMDGIFGTVMEEAPGICMEKTSVEDRRAVCSPALQRELNRLNVLDVLCLERDHRPGNYNVYIEDGKVCSLAAFDNDSPNSFGVGGVSFHNYVGCSPFIVNGKLNRPYMDRELAERICSLEDSLLKKELGDVLNWFQLRALERRIKKLRCALMSTSEKRLIDASEWSEQTIQEELAGTYGKTYLGQFLQEQKILVQPWIKDR